MQTNWFISYGLRHKLGVNFIGTSVIYYWLFFMLKTKWSWPSMIPIHEIVYLFTKFTANPMKLCRFNDAIHGVSLACHYEMIRRMKTTVWWPAPGVICTWATQLLPWRMLRAVCRMILPSSRLCKTGVGENYSVSTMPTNFKTSWCFFSVTLTYALSPCNDVFKIFYICRRYNMSRFSENLKTSEDALNWHSIAFIVVLPFYPPSSHASNVLSGVPLL